MDGKGIMPVKRRSVGVLHPAEYGDAYTNHTSLEDGAYQHELGRPVPADNDSMLYGRLFIGPTEVRRMFTTIDC